MDPNNRIDKLDLSAFFETMADSDISDKIRESLSHKPALAERLIARSYSTPEKRNYTEEIRAFYDIEGCLQEISSWNVSDEIKQDLSINRPLINRLKHAFQAGPLALPTGEPFKLELRLDGICYMIAKIHGLGDLTEERIEFIYLEDFPEDYQSNTTEILINRETVFLSMYEEVILNRLSDAMLLDASNTLHLNTTSIDLQNS